MDNILFSTGSYQLKRIDRYKYWFYDCIRYFWSWKSMILPILIVITITSGQNYFHFSILKFILVTLSVSIIFYVLLFIIALAFSFLMREFLSYRKSYNNIELNFTDTNLIFQQNGAANTIQWSDIDRLKETTSLYFILFKNKQAFIIPKRIFENEELINQFVTFAEQLISKAKAN